MSNKKLGIVCHNYGHRQNPPIEVEWKVVTGTGQTYQLVDLFFHDKIEGHVDCLYVGRHENRTVYFELINETQCQLLSFYHKGNYK